MCFKAGRAVIVFFFYILDFVVFNEEVFHQKQFLKNGSPNLMLLPPVFISPAGPEQEGAQRLRQP